MNFSNIVVNTSCGGGGGGGGSTRNIGMNDILKRSYG